MTNPLQSAAERASGHYDRDTGLIIYIMLTPTGYGVCGNVGPHRRNLAIGWGDESKLVGAVDEVRRELRMAAHG